MKNNIAILGFRGAGKSTVSRQLNKVLGMPLYTLDSYIENAEKKNITAIVQDHGWNYFRDLELKYLKSLVDLEKKGMIMDCGGGILEGKDGGFSEEKNEILRKNFICIYLYLPDAKLLTRLTKIKKNHSRPVLSGELEQILQKRKPWFEKIADLTLNTDNMTPLDIALAIRDKLKTNA
ncbi:MAG: shikimate kinase [Spirochaetia bacterium]|nr:shikimate kinase [Spirochaetia bacterium]